MFRKLFLAAVMLASVSAFAAPKNGVAAPDFTLKGADGKEWKLSQQKGKVVVLEWFNNDCPYVKKHYNAKNMQKLQKEHTAKGAVWATIVSSVPGKEGHLDAKGAKALMKEHGMASSAFLLDSDGKVGKLYAAKTTPHMYIIDKQGKLVYQGAIDDRPSASAKSLEGATNYVSEAMASITKGEPVKTASTAPYGCSIKY